MKTKITSILIFLYLIQCLLACNNKCYIEVLSENVSPSKNIKIIRHYEYCGPIGGSSSVKFSIINLNSNTNQDTITIINNGLSLTLHSWAEPNKITFSVNHPKLNFKVTDYGRNNFELDFFMHYGVKLNHEYENYTIKNDTVLFYQSFFDLKRLELKRIPIQNLNFICKIGELYQYEINSEIYINDTIEYLGYSIKRKRKYFGILQGKKPISLN
jgi:hypothetical protein